MTEPQAADTTNPRALRAAYVAFAAAFVGGGFAIWASVTDHSERLFGLGLAVALVGIGFGMVSWSKALDLEEVTQQRERLTLSDEEAAALDEDAATTAETVGRRPVLVWTFGAALGAGLAAIVAPVLSFGPSPGNTRNHTSWAPGRRLVTSDGEPISASAGRLDQLVTVFPAEHTTADDSQVVLLRVTPELIEPDTVEAGAVDGWIAYSKICTHLGCSVGLLGIDNRPPLEVRQLVCPCHQSVFDPLDGAKPTGGPAPRPLPQLPLAIDDDGFLIATADFDVPVGPLTWNEG